MSDRHVRPLSTSERWRALASLGDDNRLELALSSLPSIRAPRVRIVPGAIQAELEGTMGSINEVSIHVPKLPTRIWPQVVRVMRRSASMREALGMGRVPRSFDRLIARIANESVFPEARRVTSACTCGDPEMPCKHILALHELYARRLEDKPWELLVLRGVDLRDLLDKAEQQAHDPNLPPLSFGAHEEPVLFPEGQGADLDSTLSAHQVLSLLGVRQAPLFQAVDACIASFVDADAVEAG
ncbi:MAG: hypothetical protein KDB80_14655 [Planctomycetes bacterium]|nr:hypothetical protein [Planctomycetota bacterium]